MNRLLLKRAGALLLFAFAALLGDRLLAQGIKRFVLGTQLRFSVLYRGGQPSNVLILGDSRGANSVYSPDAQKALGLPVFNLAYNGLSTALSEAMLLDYLDHNQAPRLLVLEVTNLGSPHDMLKNLKLYDDFSSRLPSLLWKYEASTAGACTVSHLFQYNSELLLRAIYYRGQTDQTLINRYQITPDLLESIRQSTPPELKVMPENFEALQRILAAAHSRGIAVRLLVSPYQPLYAQRLPNLAAWMQGVQRAVGPEYPLWDYSQAVQADKAFADRLHMNQAGSKLLLDQLVADGFFNPQVVEPPASRRVPPSGPLSRR